MSAGQVQTSITLYGAPPWGFRLSGGVEYNQPLVITRLTPGSLAARSGVSSGDVLVAVNGDFVGNLSQDACETKVRQASGSLHLVLEKKAAQVTEHPGGQITVDADPNVYNTTSDTKQRLAQFNKTARPFGSATSTAAREPQPKKEIQSPKANGFKSISFSPKASTGTPPSSPPTSPPIVQSSAAHARHNITKAIPNKANSPPSSSPPVNISQYNSKPVAFQPVFNNTNPSTNDTPPDFVSPPQDSYLQNKYINPQSNGNAGGKKVIMGTNTPLGLYSSQNAQITYNAQAPKPAGTGHNRSARGFQPAPAQKPVYSPVYNPEKNPLFDPTALKNAAKFQQGSTVMQGPGKSKVVHAQYNTPMGMYSNDNIIDTVQAQAKSLGVSIPGAQDKAARPQFDVNSPVFRAVHAQQQAPSRSSQSRSFKMLQATVNPHA